MSSKSSSKTKGSSKTEGSSKTKEEELLLDDIAFAEEEEAVKGQSVSRQISYSNTMGPGATIKFGVHPNRIKCPTIIVPGKQKYEINIPEENIPEVIQRAQEISPLLVSHSTNIATQIERQTATRSPRIYTWILIAEIEGGIYKLKLLVNEVMSRQEIGTAHIDMFYRYSRQTGKEPDRVYLSGEFQTSTQGQKTLIEFNLSSGTFMLDKFFRLKNRTQTTQLKVDETALPSPEAVTNYFQTEILPIFFPPTKFTIVYSEKTFIKSTQSISQEEWDYLQELFKDDPAFFKSKTGLGLKRKNKTKIRKTKIRKNKTRKPNRNK